MKIKCNVCGKRFVPNKEAIYQTVEKLTLSQALMLAPEPKQYDVIDCPRCGCQHLLGIRMPALEAKVTEAKVTEKKLKVKLSPGAHMPRRAFNTDAGLDLFSTEEKVVPELGSAEFDTGVHVAIPEGYVGYVTSKSGLMMGHDITTDGTIDSGYTGSIHVKLFNHDSERPYKVLKGQKIAQLVIQPIITPKLELVDDLEETSRGIGGFGSTGKF